MRARQPEREGYAEAHGVKVFYEVFGDGDVTVVLMAGWQVAHSRLWKAQVPDLARRYRVVTYDPPGNGRSDRPTDPADYQLHRHIAWTDAVLDATSTERAVVVGYSSGTADALMYAAERPERVEGCVAIGTSIPLAEPVPSWRVHWDEDLASDEGWDKVNRGHLHRDYADGIAWFMTETFPEPHSTKQIEDCCGWAAETDAAAVVAANDGMGAGLTVAEVTALAGSRLDRVACPVLVIHGTLDHEPVEWGEALAERLGADLLVCEGSGHGLPGREPVRINRALREFVDRVHPPAPRRSVWTRAQSRRKRALFVSSPIGLGHAQRDVAIARELRRLDPDLTIDWLAQDPVTRVLDGAAETIHPASRWLASESAHLESESAEHDLHCFQAFRRMDEILVANFGVFDDLVSQEHYDLWVADEAWDLDHFLHENPERKRAAYAWLTDFVGWLPMPDGGEAEAALTADYNAEMIDQIGRFRRIRDRALFVGSAADVVPGTFGPDLPVIRDWTEDHFAFPGYVTGFDPAETADRAALRAELGYGPDEAVCLVTVGGSGVGESLLRRVIAAYPAARRRVPGLRMVVVAGPRIDPASLPAHKGLEVRAYVHQLYRHLAACDLAVVQGGLTTAMELTANRRPFLYFPLVHHFEQCLVVPHRLDRYRAGRRMDYAAVADPEVLAEAIAAEIGREVDYAPVETDGAARAAALLAELL
jgi:pimeloyl-ACP methyl ester carboxylesterase/predicted glycosyltransferase